MGGSAAALLVAGAGLVALSLAAAPEGGDETALCLTAAAMAVVGVLVWTLAARLPDPAVHLILGRPL